MLQKWLHGVLPNKWPWLHGAIEQWAEFGAVHIELTLFLLGIKLIWEIFTHLVQGPQFVLGQPPDNRNLCEDMLTCKVA